MLRCVARISYFLALLGAMIFTASFALAQTEFSADIVDSAKAGHANHGQDLFRQGQNAH